MITTIIITALVSVSITLVIGYFIWQFISVRKLNKKVEDNSNNIHGQSEWIKNLEDNTYQRFDELTKEVYKTIDERQQEYMSKFDDVNSYINKQDDDIHRELDKRFDKVYKAIEEIEERERQRKVDIKK